MGRSLRFPRHLARLDLGRALATRDLGKILGREILKS